MKRILLTAIISFLCTTAFAQREYTPKLYIGAKGGATLSQMFFSPTVQQSMLLGYMGGVSVKYT